MGRRRRERKLFTPLTRWLLEEMDKRNLSARAASIAAGLDHGSISRILSGTLPEAETCKKLANFFGVPVEQVLYLAGLSEPRADYDPFLRQIEAVTRHWSEDQKERLLRVARALE